MVTVTPTVYCLHVPASHLSTEDKETKTYFILRPVLSSSSVVVLLFSIVPITHKEQATA